MFSNITHVMVYSAGKAGTKSIYHALDKYARACMGPTPPRVTHTHWLMMSEWDAHLKAERHAPKWWAREAKILRNIREFKECGRALIIAPIRDPLKRLESDFCYRHPELVAAFGQTPNDRSLARYIAREYRKAARRAIHKEEQWWEAFRILFEFGPEDVAGFADSGYAIRECGRNLVVLLRVEDMDAKFKTEIAPQLDMQVKHLRLSRINESQAANGAKAQIATRALLKPPKHAIRSAKCYRQWVAAYPHIEKCTAPANWLGGLLARESGRSRMLEVVG